MYEDGIVIDTLVRNSYLYHGTVRVCVEVTRFLFSNRRTVLIHGMV